MAIKKGSKISMITAYSWGLCCPQGHYKGVDSYFKTETKPGGKGSTIIEIDFEKKQINCLCPDCDKWYRIPFKSFTKDK